MPGFRLRSVQPYERNIVASVLRALVALPEVAWCARMNTAASSGSYTNKKGVTKRRFVRFGFVGLSDVIGQLRDGRFFAIECKRRGGDRSDAQQLFLHWVHCAGGLAGFATSVEEALEILTGIPPEVEPRIIQAGPRPAIKCLSNPKAAQLNLSVVVENRSSFSASE